MKKIIVLATMLIIGGIILSSIGTAYEIFPGMPRHTTLIGLCFLLLGSILLGACCEHKKSIREKDDFEYLR